MNGLFEGEAGEEDEFEFEVSAEDVHAFDFVEVGELDDGFEEGEEVGVRAHALDVDFKDAAVGDGGDAGVGPLDFDVGGFGELSDHVGDFHDLSGLDFGAFGAG